MSGDVSHNGAMNLSQNQIMQVQQALSSQGEKVSSDGRWRMAFHQSMVIPKT